MSTFECDPASDTCYYKSAAITIIVLNSISLASLSFVILIYLINWKSIASFPMRLSFYLCVSCWVQNLYVLMLNPFSVHYQEQFAPTSPFCIFESIIKVAFDLSSIIWTSLIIYSVYASIVFNSSLESKEYIYIVVAFVLPLVAASIPAFFDEYGYNTYFCWFDSNSLNKQLWYKLGFYYIPLWILFIVNVILSQISYKHLKKIGISGRQLSIFKRIIMFPLILFLTGIFATIDLFYIYFTRDFVYWLDFLGIISISLYGCLTSLAYGFNPIIRDKIKSLFFKTTGQTVRTTQTSSLQYSNRSTFSSRNTQFLQMQIFPSIETKG